MPAARRASSGASRGKRGAERGRGERPRFERLLAELSVRFANVAPDVIVPAIERALGELCDALDYDRCTYCELAPEGGLRILCSAAVGGIAPIPRGPFGATIPWVVGEIRAGRVVALTDLPRGLPPAASVDARRIREIGLRSHLSIPLRVGGRVAGAISFAGFRHAPAWPKETITRLKIVGEMFASALARARSEEEAQQLRGRLWHADRVARIGALTAAIAHDLNQPLAAILSNAQAALAYLAGGRAPPDDLRTILEAIVRDEKRASETIRTMRALLRRDESGYARIDAAAAVGDVVQLLASELHRQGIRVAPQFAAGCRVMADRAQIDQVVLNLILNAAAAMQARPRDERLLGVSVARTADGRVAVAVRDSGVGIAPEHLDAVFEPFWTTRREGLGLGLVICRSIVEAHRGTISVAPNPDRGVTVCFELPAVAVDDAVDATASAPASAPGEPHPSPIGAATICVVDDDAAVREGLVRLLAAAGFTVASYPTPGEFLARASVADLACVLLDVQMPGMSGLVLQADLAGRDGAPPVVFLTGHGDVATGVEAMKRGAVDFLEKPVDRDRLLAVVREAVALRAGARARALERGASQALIRRLSARERDVLAHVLRGRLNKQIAADLKIAEQTVKQHRGRVMEKLGVRSVAELVRMCEASGLFAAPATGVAPK